MPVVFMAITLLTLCACVPAQIGTPVRNSTPVSNDIVFSDGWERIHSLGKIVVGVSADRPPFAHFNANFLIEGFEIAIMREISQQIGVQAEFHDYTQQGLEQALQSGQIDAAILKASDVSCCANPLRFSHVVYEGSDAVLTLSSSTIISVKSPADIAQKRVGVLRDGSYWSWVSTMVPPERITLLDRNEDAVTELLANNIDIAIVDLTSAEILAANGDVRIAGTALYPLRLVVGAGRSSRNLVEKVNAAMENLIQVGRIEQLAELYLRINKDNILPVPPQDPRAEAAIDATPVSVATTPANGTGFEVCNNGMSLVENLSLDDQNMTNIPAVQPGQPLTKTWRLRNSGNCPWYLSYRLVYAYGNVPEARMSGRAVDIIKEVKQGDTADIHLNLIAPTHPGIYRGVWQLIDGRRKPFGERIVVIVYVPAP